VALAAAAIAALGMAQAALVGYRTLEFGKLMHGIIETVARHVELAPVGSASDGTAPESAPRAA
jgi:hypothetical protein